MQIRNVHWLVWTRWYNNWHTDGLIKLKSFYSNDFLSPNGQSRCANNIFLLILLFFCCFSISFIILFGVLISSVLLIFLFSLSFFFFTFVVSRSLKQFITQSICPLICMVLLARHIASVPYRLLNIYDTCHNAHTFQYIHSINISSGLAGFILSSKNDSFLDYFINENIMNIKRF